MSVNLNHNIRSSWGQTRRARLKRRTPVVPPSPANSLVHDLPSLVSLVMLAVLVTYLYLR